MKSKYRGRKGEEKGDEGGKKLDKRRKEKLFGYKWNAPPKQMEERSILL
jgi:hypothetical protein